MVETLLFHISYILKSLLALPLLKLFALFGLDIKGISPLLDLGGMILRMIVIFVVFAIMPIIMVYLERKGVAFMQSRLGPHYVGPYGILQCVADGIKLFLKEIIPPRDADRLIWFLGPVIVVFPSFMLWAAVPFGPKSATLFDYNLNAGLLPPSLEMALYGTHLNLGAFFLVSVSSIAVLGIILSGWSSNNKYSLLGGMRSVSQLISYELPIGFSILAVALWTGTLDLFEIIEYQRQLPTGMWLFVPLFIPCLIFWISALAETNRTPFDLAEGESELVAGFMTEYGGLKWSFFFLAEYGNMFISSLLMSILFFGGWMPPFFEPSAIHHIPLLGPGITFFHQAMVFLLGVNLYFVATLMFKSFLFMVLFIWIRGTLPRYRPDQLMGLAWRRLLPISLLFLLVESLVKLVV